VADQFRAHTNGWIPSNAGYELRRSIRVHGSLWTACLKVHVVPAPDVSRRRRPRIEFKSSVTLWPPRLSKQEKAELARKGWYEDVLRLLRQAGYGGRWMSSPSGKFGDFWKDLHDIQRIRKEAEWLEAFQLTAKPLQE
jgi:hypothetical protein